MSKRWLVAGVGGGVSLLLLGVTLMLPSSYRAEASVIIDAPADQIFPRINRLRSWPAWDPWRDRDPSIQTTYEGAEEGAGARQRWSSERSGDGRLRITFSEAPSRVEMSFVIDDRFRSEGVFLIRQKPEDRFSQVLWRSHGDLPDGLAYRWMGLLLAPRIRRDHEAGLLNLKRVVEGA